MLDPATPPAVETAEGPVRIALAGNPNCGKTSIFNALTGAHQHVANYPGVTVEKRTGACSLGERRAQIIDLPGTYSLSAYSPEERVAEQELATAPDVVVVVADSMQLQRNLVLLAQVMQTGANPILCLNMADEARAAGLEIDLAQMERLLGFPVVETVGHRGRGIDGLRRAIEGAARSPVSRHRLVLGEDLDRALANIRTALPASMAREPSGDWTAVRLLLGDIGHTSKVAAIEGGQAAVDYSPLVGFSMMVFLLIATPCMATVVVTRRESGRWRWALLQFGGLTGIAYLASLLVYQLGRSIS